MIRKMGFLMLMLLIFSVGMARNNKESVLLKQQRSQQLYFSTEEDFLLTSLTTGATQIVSDGDLLSARSGVIVLPNSVLLHNMIPAGIPMRGVDFGLDAFLSTRDGNKEMSFFSTEILYFDREHNILFTDGDILRTAVLGIVVSNTQLISQFRPRANFLGLDAMSFFEK